MIIEKIYNIITNLDPTQNDPGIIKKMILIWFANEETKVNTELYLELAKFNKLIGALGYLPKEL